MFLLNEAEKWSNLASQTSAGFLSCFYLFLQATHMSRSAIVWSLENCSSCPPTFSYHLWWKRPMGSWNKLTKQSVKPPWNNWPNICVCSFPKSLLILASLIPMIASIAGQLLINPPWNVLKRQMLHWSSILLSICPL